MVCTWGRKGSVMGTFFRKMIYEAKRGEGAYSEYPLARLMFWSAVN